MTRRNTGATPAMRATVLDRDDHCCAVCTVSTGLQVHHRRPRGMGGTSRATTNEAPNLITVCAHHHAYLESHRVWALEHGFLVHQNDDPAEVPVTTWRGPVLLLPDGTLDFLLDPDRHTEGANE